MPRQKRIVIPQLAHHVTQRGNQKQQVFFEVSDYRFYLNLLNRYATRGGAKILAYCLMPNHLHLILVPQEEDSLRAALAPLHTAYAQAINRRFGFSGHLWQDRYASYPLGETHLVSALRYVELNPVRAGLRQNPLDYPFSSAAGHAGLREDPLLTKHPAFEEIGDWRAFLASGLDETEEAPFRQHAKNGLPLGNGEFISQLESRLGTSLRAKKRGPRPRKRKT
jgi:putative transposase